MAEATVTASVGGLNINDGVNYILSPEGLNPATVVYRRTQVMSPFVEGRFTTNRLLDAVEGEMQVDVLGSSQADLASNIAALIAAFTQDTYTLTISLDGTSYSWECEAADYSMDWTHTRVHARRVPMRFAFQRQPTPAAGPI